MKKILSQIVTVLVLATVLVGCSSNSNSKESSENNAKQGKISIVTTIFPEYDWVKEITKGVENVEISMLLDNGVDLHSFQPTADDIIKVSDCDMFIYVGGESDEWVEDALAQSNKKNRVVINLLDVLGDAVKEEEVVEGMEGEEEEEEAGEEEGPEYDEHVWLSLKNAKTLSDYIQKELSKIDAENADMYQANATAYLDKLETLDKEYADYLGSVTTKTLLFGDRFPFRYLVDDYGLDYYAAFVGCSAESEASFETITFLAKKVDELGLGAIFQIEGTDGKIANTIKENTKDKNQEIYMLDSMQSTTSKEVEEGATYLSIMEKNLGVFKEALK